LTLLHPLGAASMSFEVLEPDAAYVEKLQFDAKKIQPLPKTYMDLKSFLEDRLGCRVDLVIRKSIRPRLRARRPSMSWDYLQFLEDMRDRLQEAVVLH
jgi:hypothetical protein